MCKSLVVRAIIGISVIVLYSISIVTVVDILSLESQDYSISSILLQPVFLIIIILISLIVLYYITILNRSILASLAIPLILYQLSFVKPIPSIVLLLTIISSYIIIIILIIRAMSKGGGDAVISYYTMHRRISKGTRVPYTLLSSYILILYIYLYIINYPYNINGLLLHILISTISIIISYSSYNSVQESLISGIVSGLGPIGYAIITTWYSNKPIPVSSKCEGVIVGELIAIEGRMTTNRSMLKSHRAQWSSRTFFCVGKGRAEINVNMRGFTSVLWLYGIHSEIIYNNIININKLHNYPILIIKLDSKGAPIEKIEEELAQATSLLASGGKSILKLGSLEDARVKIATASTIINNLPEYDNLVLIIDADIIDTNDILTIIKPALEKASLTIVAIKSPSWLKEALIPVSLNVKQGFIVSGIKDPMTALKVASTFLESSSGAHELKDFVQVKGIGLGYPSCIDGAFIFKY